MSVLPVHVYTNHMRESLHKAAEKLSAGTLGAYDQYATTSYEADMSINGHRLRMKYTLRIDIATPEIVALAVPTAKVTVTYSAYDKDNDQWYHPNANKETEFELVITAVTLDDQITQAIDLLQMIIAECQMPEVKFDFWAHVTDSMKSFEKIAACTARNNSDLITRIK